MINNPSAARENVSIKKAEETERYFVAHANFDIVVHNITIRQILDLLGNLRDRPHERPIFQGVCVSPSRSRCHGRNEVIGRT